MGVFAVIMIITLVVVILGGVIWFVNQSIQGSGGDVIKDLNDCQTEPYIDYTAEDPYSGGSVSVGVQAIVDGAYVGTFTLGSSGTKVAIDDEVKLLIGDNNVINRTVDVTIKTCGSNRVIGDQTEVLKTSAVTLTVLDQNLNALQDSSAGAGSTGNVTSASGVVTFVVRLRGTSDESTGDLLVTYEGNDTQIDDFQVTGPDLIDGDFREAIGYKLFASEGSTPVFKGAFIVGALLDGQQADYYVGLEPESGVTIGEDTLSTANFVNVYSAQACVEDDNTFLERCWETDRGTSKYEDKSTDFDFAIE